MPQGKNSNKLIKNPVFTWQQLSKNNSLLGPLFWEVVSVSSLVYGPEDYRPYLCTAAELEVSYARCCSLGVPPGLARPRHVLSPDEVGSRLKAGAPLITFAKRIITPVCCAGPQSTTAGSLKTGGASPAQ